MVPHSLFQITPNQANRWALRYNPRISPMEEKECGLQSEPSSFYTSHGFFIYNIWFELWRSTPTVAMNTNSLSHQKSDEFIWIQPAQAQPESYTRVSGYTENYIRSQHVGSHQPTLNGSPQLLGRIQFKAYNLNRLKLRFHKTFMTRKNDVCIDLLANISITLFLLDNRKFNILF